jgi:hypothetical protein
MLNLRTWAHPPNEVATDLEYAASLAKRVFLGHRSYGVATLRMKLGEGVTGCHHLKQSQRILRRSAGWVTACLGCKSDHESSKNSSPFLYRIISIGRQCNAPLLESRNDHFRIYRPKMLFGHRHGFFFCFKVGQPYQFHIKRLRAHHSKIPKMKPLFYKYEPTFWVDLC